MKYNVKLKNKEEIESLRKSGKILAQVLKSTASEVRPGVTTKYLDDFANKKILELGAKPALLGYQPWGADYPYPGSICLSVNDEAVHGIGGKRVLKEGDLIKLDCAISYNGMISDSAITVPVGDISKEDEELCDVTKKALASAIKVATSGNYVNDISKAIEKAVPKKFGIVKILAGHGVGHKVHEEPTVPNFDDGLKGPKLVPGMVLAIEPIISRGDGEVILEDDGYTFTSVDGSNVAQFEHTILITEGKAEIITIE